MNRRRLSLLFFLLITLISVYSEPLKILSFNLNGNIKSHRLETNELWASDIVAIIKQSKADIVLLQEVSIDLDKRLDTEYFKNPKENNVLDFFCRKLSGSNGSWKYYTSAGYMLRKDMEIDGITYKNGNKTQNNAILYNSGKLKGDDEAKRLGFTDFSGKYRFDKNSVQVIEFTEIDSGSKLNVINVHIPYNDFENYKRDLDTLEKLYASLKLKTAVIIGGDFNTSRMNLMDRNFDNVDGTTGWYYDKYFGLCSTVSQTNDRYFEYCSDYDHFIYNKKVNIIQIMKRAGISSKDNNLSSIKIGNNTFYNSEEYFERISDHFPVILEFEIAD